MNRSSHYYQAEKTPDSNKIKTRITQLFEEIPIYGSAKVHQPTREFMKQDVAKYIKYYNLDRLHSANDSMTPANFENSQIKVSCLG